MTTKRKEKKERQGQMRTEGGNEDIKHHNRQHSRIMLNVSLVFFGTWSLAKWVRPKRSRTQNDNKNNNKVCCIFSSFASSSFLCFFFSVSRFSCYSSFISRICFFFLFLVFCSLSFFLAFILLSFFLPAFSSNFTKKRGKKKKGNE